MSNDKYGRLGTIAAALAMTLTTASAPASSPLQAAGNAKVVRAICCRCVDGSQQTVSLNTRTAPWTVSTGNGPAQPVINGGNPGWSPAAPAGWVAPPKPSGTIYTYKLTIVVPRCVIGGRVALKGRFGADNSGQLKLNGNTIASTSGGIQGFQAPNFGSFSTNIGPGTYTLSVEVKNPHGPTGMVLQGDLITQCPRSTELGAARTDASEAFACKCEGDTTSA